MEKITNYNMETIENLPVARKLTDSSQEWSPDAITAYKCRRGWIVVVNVNEETNAYFTTDPDDITAESLITCAIYDSDAFARQLITRCKYGVDQPEDYVISADKTETTIIIREGNCYNHTPLDILTTGDYADDRGPSTSEPLLFASAADAYAWIDKYESNQIPYYCSHGEAGAPNFYVWAADL